MPRDDQDGSVEGTQDVDLSSMPRPRGMTLYGSTKIERNSKSVNATATASVTYAPPENESYAKSLDIFQQVHHEALKRTWFNAELRKAAVEVAELGGDATQFEPDFETNYITPEMIATVEIVKEAKADVTRQKRGSRKPKVASILPPPPPEITEEEIAEFDHDLADRETSAYSDQYLEEDLAEIEIEEGLEITSDDLSEIMVDEDDQVPPPADEDIDDLPF